MTLNDKNWLKNEVTRLYLSGYSQEDIAREVNKSVGTVNALISEAIESDDTIELMRQIAIISKKNRVDIKQIASNLRYQNKIKQSSLDERKIEKFLDAMSMLFNKYGISPTTAANQFFSLIETMLKHNIEPHRLEEEIQLQQNKLEMIKNQVETNENVLEESRANIEKEQTRLQIKQKDLQDFRKVRQMLNLFGDLTNEVSSKYGDFARAMMDIKNLGYDPKVIISKYDNMLSLTSANEKLEAKLQKSEKIFEAYRRREEEEKARWKDNYNAFKIFEGLVKDGLKPEDIFTLVHIIKNDFPQDAISQIKEDINTYGSLSASAWRLKRQDERR